PVEGTNLAGDGSGGQCAPHHRRRYQRLRFIRAGIAPRGSLRVATATTTAAESTVPTTSPATASRPPVEMATLARSEAEPARARSTAVCIGTSLVLRRLRSCPAIIRAPGSGRAGHGDGGGVNGARP